ncbi:MAG: hypothetical protein RBU27_06115 [Bacteroidota bacterium]|jgi:membrane-associated phospholipid phosphatase|nr:hypothetical protein [Bacteroidota bacterium]
MESRQTRVAHHISIALIPPTIAAAVFAVLVLAYEHGSTFHQVVVWIVATLCAGGLQMLYVLSLRKREEVTAYDVPERLQRTKPYAVSVGISFAGLLILHYLNASVFVWGLMWCFLVNTLILGAINLRWKISAHMMGLTGPLVFLFPLFGWTLLWLLPLAALLGWARVTVRAHTLSQVLAGAAAGILLTLIQSWVILALLLPMLQ